MRSHALTFLLALGLALPLPGPLSGPAASATALAAATQPATRTGARGVSAGGEHSCSVPGDGTLWCWGRNQWGQIGTGRTGRGPKSSVQVGTRNDWASVAAGGGSTCAIRKQGTLWCWGVNHRGQLGDGGDHVRSRPHRVGAASTWTQVSAGWFTTCGVRADGTAWCWGDNSAGQLGTGSTGNRSRPARVAGSGWRQLAVTGWHTCGVKRDGSLWCWGRNLFGQLGDGSWRDRTSPVRVGETANWAGVDVSWSHTCGLKTNGRIRCWGRNTFGQLGDGSTRTRNTPGAVVNERPAVDVAVAEATSCLADADQRLRCWGSNAYGAFGNGSRRGSRTPRRGDGAHRWLSGGWLHLCALRPGAGVGCWGNNERGQLGDGSTTDSSTPVRTGTRRHTRGRRAGYQFVLGTVNVLGNGHTRAYAHDDRFAPSRMRAEWLADALREQDVGVVGLQETTAGQLSSILRATDGAYGVFPRPEKDDLSVETALLWRTSEWRATRRTVIRSQFIRRSLPRPVVRLRNRATGRQIWVMNVHNAPWSYQQRRDAATRVQLVRLRELTATGLPVFYVGDMNEKATILCKVLRRTELVSPLGGSLRDGRCRTPDRRMRVDWIFGSAGLRYSDYEAERRPLFRMSTDHWVPLVHVTVP